MKKFFIFFLGAFIFFYHVVAAAGNISTDAAQHWAWNDIIGWFQFNTVSNTMDVNVTGRKIQGSASSTSGYLSLDASSTLIGDITSQSSYAVTNDGAGNLSGYAWNDLYGWFSFDCHNHATGSSCTYPYQTTIDSSGDFSGYAWNDLIGWVSFNCAGTVVGCNPSSTPAGVDYKVHTSWTSTSTVGTLDSTTFDTGVSGGAQINSILWRGDAPANTAVEFQLAVSSSSVGPWVFQGPSGSSSYYPWPDTTLTADQSIPVDFTLHNNARYFRYRIILVSNPISSAAPRVDEVIINWSP